MGISGLLPCLKPIQKNSHLNAYANKSIAIDAYSWLHKAIISSNLEIYHNKSTNKYLNYFIKKLNLLAHFNISPYLVFDGDYLPTKASTESSRSQSRLKNKQLADAYFQQANYKKALDAHLKSIDISPPFAKTIIDYLKANNIKYIVAPYEADSQLVYLEKSGLVDAVISEDSDLLIFGCKTLLTKLNDSGHFIEISSSDFTKIPSFSSLNHYQLKLVVSLCGCDYYKGIPNIGLKTSLSLVKKYSNLKKLLLFLRFQNKFKIPSNFDQIFLKVYYCFTYQRVFDPITSKITTLNPIPSQQDNQQNNYQDNETPIDYNILYSCIGKKYDDQNLHYLVSIGEIDPFTHKKLISRE
ncbi:exonuclease 1 family protein, partial [Ascoidea rubescens DSM 1968]